MVRERASERASERATRERTGRRGRFCSAARPARRLPLPGARGEAQAAGPPPLLEP
jgi:hypothetical protein